MSKFSPQKIKQVSYLKNFKCAGEACVDNCCVGWIIGVTPENKKFYEEQNCEIVKDLEPHNKEFQVRRCNDGSCSQLKNNLCTVQQNFGVEYLPDICYNFPRTHKKIAGDVYMSANLACPESLKIGLFSKDKNDFMAWDFIEQSRAKNNLYSYEINGIENFAAQKVEKIFSLMIEMIDDTNFDSDFSVAKLLILAKKIGSTKDFDWLNLENEIATITKSKIIEISENKFREIDMRQELVNVLKVIFDLIITYNGRYDKVMDLVKESVGDYSENEEKLLNNFEPIFDWWSHNKFGFDNILKNFIKTKMSYLGYLLVSESKTFSAKSLALEYLVVKLVLMCLSFGLKRELTQFEIIEAIQPITKRFYSIKSDRLKEFFEKQPNWQDSQKVAAIILNFS